MAFPKVKLWTFLQIMLGYGLLTEILQDEMHMGRSMEILDLVADMLGVAIGYWIYKKVKALGF